MSLVSNFIGNISSTQFGELTKTSQHYDLDDTTFAKLLEKQMGEKLEETQPIPQLGMPAGFNIEPVEGLSEISPINEIQQIDESNSEKFHNPLDNNGDGEVTTSEAVTFFTSLLDHKSAATAEFSNLFDFAQKQATNFYNKYSRNVITDVNEFVDDVKSMI